MLMTDDEIQKKSDAMQTVPNVIVYSSPTCQFCNEVKEYFRIKKIKFTEYDVSVNKEKAAEMIKKTGRTSVPVLDINGTIIIGFDRDAIEVALRRKTPITWDIGARNITFDPFSR